MFSEEKATALACAFLTMAGGKLEDLKLMKLMYLADREALRVLGSSITGDSYFSMRNGPVLSETLDLMTPRDQDDRARIWREHISLPSGYQIRQVRPLDPGRVLSPAELDIVRQVWTQFGTWGKWQLVEYVHRLPEYTPTSHSSVPIAMRSLLEALGFNEEEVRRRLEHLRQHDAMDHLLAEPSL